MYSSSFDFGIPLFKSIIQEAPTQENGWRFEYEGVIDKSFPGIDCFVKLHFSPTFRLKNENLQ